MSSDARQRLLDSNAQLSTFRHSLELREQVQHLGVQMNEDTESVRTNTRLAAFVLFGDTY